MPVKSEAKQRNIATIQMIICSILWSIAGLFMKFIPWHPFALAGARSLFAALTVAVFMLFTKSKIKITKSVIISAVFLAATFLCFTTANKLSTAANAIVLQFTAPVFILIFELITRRRGAKLTDFLCVGATMVGIILFVFDSLGQGMMLGNIAGILAGVTMAGMFVCVGEAPEKEKMSGILFGHILTAVIGLPFMFFTDAPLTFTSVGSLITLGVVQLGIPYILLGCAVGRCPALAACLISAIEPLLNPIWVAIFYGEIPGIMSLFGGIIVIAAVTVYCLLDRKATS